MIKNKMKESEDNRNQEKNNKNQELTVVFDNIKNYENQKKDFKNIQKNNQVKIEDNTHNITVLKSRISQITIELEEKKKLIENSPTNHWQTWAAASAIDNLNNEMKNLHKEITTLEQQTKKLQEEEKKEEDTIESGRKEMEQKIGIDFLYILNHMFLETYNLKLSSSDNNQDWVKKNP